MVAASPHDTATYTISSIVYPTRARTIINHHTYLSSVARSIWDIFTKKRPPQKASTTRSSRHPARFPSRRRHRAPPRARARAHRTILIVLDSPVALARATRTARARIQPPIHPRPRPRHRHRVVLGHPRARTDVVRVHSCRARTDRVRARTYLVVIVIAPIAIVARRLHRRRLRRRRPLHGARAV
jgi:hypothetical protein